MRSICPAGPACAAALAQSDAIKSQRGEEGRGASVAHGRHGKSGRCKLTRAPAQVEAARPTRAHARSGPLGATTPSQGSSLEASSSLVTFPAALPTCQISLPGRHSDCSGRKMVDPHIAEKLLPTRKRGQQGRRPAAALDGAPSACYTRVSVGKKPRAPEKVGEGGISISVHGYIFRSE